MSSFVGFSAKGETLQVVQHAGAVAAKRPLIRGFTNQNASGIAQHQNTAAETHTHIFRREHVADHYTFLLSAGGGSGIAFLHSELPSRHQHHCVTNVGNVRDHLQRVVHHGFLGWGWGHTGISQRIKLLYQLMTLQTDVRKQDGKGFQGVTKKNL